VPLTPAERTIRAKIAANTKWGHTEDRAAATAAARRAHDKKFEELADPNGKLPPAERARRAKSLRNAHFQRLAMKSAQARRRRSGAA
jgi:hypothetical protein